MQESKLGRHNSVLLGVLALSVACLAWIDLLPLERDRTGIRTKSGGQSLLPDSAQARVEVVAELRSYYADFSARDWEKFAGHFWEGATLTTVWQPPGEDAERVVVTSVPEFVAQAPQGPGSKPIFEEQMTDAQVRVSGTLAQAWAHYHARFGEPGAVAEWAGIDAFTLMKHGGQWKIVALAYAADQEEGGSGSPAADARTKMERVTGLGGVFFKAKDPQRLRAWYRKHLGIGAGRQGSRTFPGETVVFEWREKDEPERVGYTVWGPFPTDTKYFDPSPAPFMFNYRVADLDRLLHQLRREGVQVEDRIQEYEYGRFGWIIDPEGNRVELWEPTNGH